MAFDAIGFYQQYGIEYVTQGHKHCREGWVQVKCPFCIGNPGWHLGFELDRGWYCCWRCGYHRVYDTIVALLNGNRREAEKALAMFKGRPTPRRFREHRTTKVLKLPDGLQPLTRRARAYLEGRKFDPDMLSAIWKIQSTANFGNLKYRIFIPIFVDNRMVSWQARDVTGSGKMKYIAQREDKEIINNKETLYGIDQATGDSCVVVEGVTDVWRLGPGAIGLFGIKYRPAQVTALLRNFSSFHVLFDSDPQAIIQAEKLAADLSVLGGKVKVWSFNGSDPGDLDQDDADTFMRSVLGHGAY